MVKLFILFAQTNVWVNRPTYILQHLANMEAFLETENKKHPLILQYLQENLTFTYIGKNGDYMERQDEDGSWFSLLSTNFADGQQFHQLKQMTVVASARNIELYVADNIGVGASRTYIKTMRGGNWGTTEGLLMDTGANMKEGGGYDINNLFKFTIGPADIECSGREGGQFRYIYMKFLSLKPMGTKKVKIYNISVEIAQDPYIGASNPILPIEHRSAAASGGVGGVMEVSAETLASLLGAIGGAGTGTAGPTHTRAPMPIPHVPISVPVPAPVPASATGTAADTGNVTSAGGMTALISMLPLLLSQVGALLDSKLAPIHQRLDTLDNTIAKLAIAFKAHHADKEKDKEKEKEKESA